MKKNVISTVLSVALLLSTASFAKDNTSKFVPENTTTSDIVSTKNSRIKAMYTKSPEFFTNAERLEEDLELESLLIENFDKKFVKQKGTFSPEEYNLLMNSYFIDALKTNNSRLADFILYKSGALIDVNFKKTTKPRISPLMATATGIGLDGGNIEYFIKLIEMGADVSEVTENYNIPLMSLASTVDNYKIVLYLALLGENVMHLDEYDFYPLDYAARNDSSKTVILLTGIIKDYKTIIDKQREERMKNKTENK